MAYGLVTVYLLSLSWTKPGEKIVTITKNIVIAMLVIQIALNLDIATTGGFEWAGLLLLAIMLGTNWLAVKYVATYKKA